MLVDKLKTRLPEAHLRKKVKKVRKIPQIDRPTETVRFSSELQKLEKELRNVEKTISKIK